MEEEGAGVEGETHLHTTAGEAWSHFPATMTPEAGSFRPLVAAVADFVSDKVDNNFLKDVKWSPDGLCLLTSSDDNAIRLFEPGGGAADSAQLKEEAWCLPQHDRVKSVLKVQEGETIYDFAWLPTMISSDPASCCFFSTSRDNPVHVWDAFTGRCRGSYCAYTDAEELTAGYCIAFNENAGSEQMYVGFNNCVRVFDLSRPGREHRILPTFKRANRETTGQRGIISCIAFNPDKSGLYACGSYSRNVGLYAAPKGNLLYNLQGQRGGITQVQWSRDGNYLFSGGRKDREILCWDVRNTGDVLLSLPRLVSTNQRLQVPRNPCLHATAHT
jgi:WD40 repeat protein